MPVTMPQALEFVGSLVWDYWDEIIIGMVATLSPAAGPAGRTAPPRGAR